MRAAVRVHIDAPPDRSGRSVTDITKMGDYSPEVIEAESIEGCHRARPLAPATAVT